MRRISKAAAAIAAAVSIASFPVACMEGSSPTGAARGFLTAAKGGDRQALLGYVQPKDRAFLEKMGKEIGTGFFALPKGADFRLGQEKVAGDGATVAFTALIDGKESSSGSVSLVREDGRWWIDLVPDGPLDVLGGLEKVLKTK